MKGKRTVWEQLGRKKKGRESRHRHSFIREQFCFSTRKRKRLRERRTGTELRGEGRSREKNKCKSCHPSLKGTKQVPEMGAMSTKREGTRETTKEEVFPEGERTLLFIFYCLCSSLFEMTRGKKRKREGKKGSNSCQLSLFIIACSFTFHRHFRHQSSFEKLQTRKKRTFPSCKTLYLFLFNRSPSFEKRDNNGAVQFPACAVSLPSL